MLRVGQLLHFFFSILLISISLCIEVETNWTKITGNSALGHFYSNSERLYDELFNKRNYKKQISPVYSLQPKNVSAQIVPRFALNISLSYVRVIDLVAQSQEVQQLFEFGFTWKDPRLSWDPKDFGGIKTLWLQYDTVWMPENSISDAIKIKEVIPMYQKQVEVDSSGAVFYDSTQFVSLSCPMDLTYFPFDVQTCVVGFDTYTYNYSMVTQNGAIWRDFDKRIFKGNGEWVIINISVAKKTILTPDFPYDWVYYTFVYRRKPHFYIWVIVLPAFLLTFLSVIGLFWTSKSVDEKLIKLTLGLTTMMSMTVLLDLVSNQIPKTSQFPVLGIYVIIDFCIIGVSCALIVILPRDQGSWKAKEADSRTKKLQKYLISKNFFLQVFFQLLNLINLIVLMAFWRDNKSTD